MEWTVVNMRKLYQYVQENGKIWGYIKKNFYDDSVSVQTLIYQYNRFCVILIHIFETSALILSNNFAIDAKTAYVYNLCLGILTRERFHRAWMEHMKDPSYKMPEIPRNLLKSKDYQKYDTFSPQDFVFFEWLGVQLEKENVVRIFEEALEREGIEKVSLARGGIAEYDDSQLNMFLK